jgi:hypothetical protein
MRVMVNIPYRIAVTACMLFFFCAAGSHFMQAEQAVPMEKTFVFTDRNFYIAGEQLYFKFRKVSPNARGLNSNYGYVLLRSAGNVVIEQATLELHDEIAYGSIYLPDTLQTGFYQLLGFTNQMRNNPGILSSAKEVLIVNRFDNELNFLLNRQPFEGHLAKPSDITTSPSIVNVHLKDSVFPARSKIQFDLELVDTLKTLELSVSIAQEGSVNSFNSRNVDFSPFTEHPDEPPIARKAAFPTESRGIIISGRVFSTQTGKGAEHAIVFLSARDSILNLQYSKAGEDGVFHFYLSTYYYDQDVFISLHPDFHDKNLQIEMFDKSGIPEPFRIAQFTMAPELEDHIRASQKIVKVQKALQQNHHIVFSEIRQKKNPPLLYSRAERTIHLSEYVPLNDFLEISRELIEPLRIRQTSGGVQVSLVNKSTRTLFNDPPFLFLDGLLIREVEQILALGSAELKKIEVHNLHWVFGELEFPGIIALYTHDPEAIRLSENHLQRHIQAPSKSSGFSFSEWENIQDNGRNEPDLRQLLYWNPSIKLSPAQKLVSIEFFSSDVKDDYIIRVEAISKKGTQIIESKKLKVI